MLLIGSVTTDHSCETGKASGKFAVSKPLCARLDVPLELEFSELIHSEFRSHLLTHVCAEPTTPAVFTGNTGKCYKQEKTKDREGLDKQQTSTYGRETWMDERI